MLVIEVQLSPGQAAVPDPNFVKIGLKLMANRQRSCQTANPPVHDFLSQGHQGGVLDGIDYSIHIQGSLIGVTHIGDMVPFPIIDGHRPDDVIDGGIQDDLGLIYFAIFPTFLFFLLGIGEHPASNQRAIGSHAEVIVEILTAEVGTGVPAGDDRSGRLACRFHPGFQRPGVQGINRNAGNGIRRHAVLPQVFVAAKRAQDGWIQGTVAQEQVAGLEGGNLGIRTGNGPDADFLEVAYISIAAEHEVAGALGRNQCGGAIVIPLAIHKQR